MISKVVDLAVQNYRSKEVLKKEFEDKKLEVEVVG